MENNTHNKALFFALYYGQSIMTDAVNFNIIVNHDLNWQHNSFYLELTPLSDITDEDAIQVARLTHQIPEKQFNVKRKDDIIYIDTEFNKYGIQYFVSMIYKYGTVCARMNFKERDGKTFDSNTVNIGQVNMDSKQPIPYIAIVDYLRSKGYALPYMDLSVDDLVNYGWVKLKTK